MREENLIAGVLRHHQIVPVIDIQDAANADGLARALIAGGLPVAEITLRSPGAMKAVECFSRHHPEIMLGVGTVSSAQQVNDAVNAGARFVVTPGLNSRVISSCLNKNMPVIAGVCTPSDIEIALAYDLETLKFFPAEAAGGVEMLDALGGPYRNLKFIPTGGINQYNLMDYLSCRNVIACGGSWMAKSHMISDRQFNEIARLTASAVQLTRRLGAA